MKISIYDSMWLTGVGVALVLSALWDKVGNPLSFVGVIFIVRGTMGLIKVKFASSRKNEKEVSNNGI